MTSPTSVHVPFATTGIDIEQDCRACLTHGPHPSLTVPGDAATGGGVRDRFRYFACASFIAPEARKTYRRRAAEINARGRGDQAAFYLQATG
ncbi:hypothetical protein [Sphingomonas sp. Leaf343]|uniref:hypothetical protein n=1 Tax=Sphingomonas sp. Leaf343 TaxID=1736345 RepID=UPI0012E2E52F|nr:hypothetical protein [Sphingomonas sp. Leaf343]